MSTEAQQEAQEQVQSGGGVRIETDFWLRVIGRDSEPTLRRGNICASGFFFQVQGWPGRAGDIAVMEVSSEDQAQSFTTMASVARIVGTDEARWSSIEQGVSYQFLPSDEATRSAIARTVRHIAEQHPEQAGELAMDDFQRAASEGAYPGAGEAAQPVVEAGARVRLLVAGATAESSREVIGVVGDITESVQADGATRFWVPVFLVEEKGNAEVEDDAAGQPATEPSTRISAEAAAGSESLIDDMWKELVPEARSILAGAGDATGATGRSHLSGRLSQISMPSALWLLDQERLSGALEFRRKDERVTLWLSQGRVIDAESPDADKEPRALLRELMRWDDGEFEFRVEDVEREDRVGVDIQRLLLDLAVEADEEAR